MSVFGSMKYQVCQAFGAIHEPGMSKADKKEQGIGDHEVVRSTGTLETYRKDITAFANWAKKEYGISDIRDLNQLMAKAWLHTPKANGDPKAAYTITTYVEALKAFGPAMEAKYGIQVSFVSPAYAGPTRYESDKSDSRQAYTPAEAQGIANYLMAKDPESGVAFRIMVETGFRAVTVVGDKYGNKGIRASGFDPHKGTVEGIHKTGKNTIICKWDIDFKKHPNHLEEHRVSPELVKDIAKLAEGRVGREKIFSPDLTYSKLYADIRGAHKALGIECREAAHSARYLYAQTQYDRYIGQGLSEEQAKMRLSDDLGHGRPEICSTYLKGR